MYKEMKITSPIKRTESERLFEASKTFFPGGVNSPVRAFKSVGGTPLFIKKGNGALIWDEDDNEFIDFCCSWGPLILGHNHPQVFSSIVSTLENGSSFGAPTRKENDLAQFILERIPFIDKMRFTSSGTEAVMSAIRLARGYTGKTKIVKFDGCYHGHVDALLVNAGSGLATFGTSSSAGVPEIFANETLVLPLNDIETLRTCLTEYADDIACVIIEPIPANNGLLLQDKHFLLVLREICTELGILLIFDEVISGFRVAFGGAAELYDITPDIVTYGKILGGGLPVGAYAAKKHIMAFVSPDGPVYQAGTLSGNPVAMAAGLAQLKECAKNNFYQELEEKALYMVNQVNAFTEENNYPLKLVSLGSIFWFSFNGRKSIAAAKEINPDMTNFNRLHAFLLDEGIYFGPSGYEVGFISQAHTQAQLEKASKKIQEGLAFIFKS
ncbi:MAG: glutamate-1-semialdehyde-2,1-aminomutase [Flavobacteriia bacterium]|nr:glutamate-1-semialdehyde-2,1-aminomutase [Flavobacteriia bacterium]